jgi:hypothetical protein
MITVQKDGCMYVPDGHGVFSVTDYDALEDGASLGRIRKQIIGTSTVRWQIEQYEWTNSGGRCWWEGKFKSRRAAVNALKDIKWPRRTQVTG